MNAAKPANGRTPQTSAAPEPQPEAALLDRVVEAWPIEPRRYQSTDITQIATALASAQAEITNPPKDHTNPHFRSTYADLAGVLNVARKPLAANGLSVVQTVIGDHEHPYLRTMLLHSSGQWIAGEIPLYGDLDKPQVLGSVLTYMRRYALAAIVGVAQEDDDGNLGQPRQQERRQSPAPSRLEPRTGPPPAPVEQPIQTGPGDITNYVQGRIVEVENDWTLLCAEKKVPHEKLGINVWQVINGVVTNLIADRKLDPAVVVEGTTRSTTKVKAEIRRRWQEDNLGLKRAIEAYLTHKHDEAAAKVGINLDSEPLAEPAAAESAKEV